VNNHGNENENENGNEKVKNYDNGVFKMEKGGISERDVDKI